MTLFLTVTYCNKKTSGATFHNQSQKDGFFSIPSTESLKHISYPGIHHNSLPEEAFHANLAFH